MVEERKFQYFHSAREVRQATLLKGCLPLYFVKSGKLTHDGKSLPSHQEINHSSLYMEELAKSESIEALTGLDRAEKFIFLIYCCDL